jgi:hypothetical protein
MAVTTQRQIRIARQLGLSLMDIRRLQGELETFLARSRRAAVAPLTRCGPGSRVLAGLRSLNIGDRESIGNAPRRSRVNWSTDSL